LALAKRGKPVESDGARLAAFFPAEGLSAALRAACLAACTFFCVRSFMRRVWNLIISLAVSWLSFS
jgi:hypothetical protein